MSFTAFSQPFKSPFEIARQNAFHFFLPRRPLPAALLSSPESPVERDVSLKGLQEVIYRFFHLDHDWLVSNTSDGKPL